MQLAAGCGEPQVRFLCFGIDLRDTQDVASHKYLLTLAVGYTEKANVNATVHKFSDNIEVVLFHYDRHATEWDEFAWSRCSSCQRQEADQMVVHEEVSASEHRGAVRVHLPVGRGPRCR